MSRPTLDAIAAALRDTFDRQVATTPSGRKIARTHAAEIERLATNVVGNLAMIVDGWIEEAAPTPVADPAYAPNGERFEIAYPRVEDAEAVAASYRASGWPIATVIPDRPTGSTVIAALSAADLAEALARYAIECTRDDLRARRADLEERIAHLAAHGNGTAEAANALAAARLDLAGVDAELERTNPYRKAPEATPARRFAICQRGAYLRERTASRGSVGGIARIWTEDVRAALIWSDPLAAQAVLEAEWSPDELALPHAPEVVEVIA